MSYPPVPQACKSPKPERGPHSAYMPFYSDEFWPEVTTAGDAVTVAYLRAMNHYWRQCQCQPLLDDDDHLWNICGRPREWDKIKPVVFGKHFVRDEVGMWVHLRTIEHWRKSLETWIKRCKQTAKATEAKKRKRQQMQRNGEESAT